MLLFNNYELENPYILHTPHTNDKTNVQIPSGGRKNNEKILEFRAMRCIRVATGDCTGAVSTPACERAGMVAVNRLLYDQYKEDNKVVFQNTPTNSSCPDDDGSPTAGHATIRSIP